MCRKKKIASTIKRFRETGSYENRRRSGRKRKTTTRQDRYLERLALRNRFQRPKQLAADLSVEQDVSLCDSSKKVGRGEFEGREKPNITLDAMYEIRKLIIVCAKYHANVEGRTLEKPADAYQNQRIPETGSEEEHRII
ncbi:hypothetical protein Trydic_g5643 [Trypoxylus dichotomus]